jgi:uncharacterized protein (UPF0333 family)
MTPKLKKILLVSAVLLAIAGAVYYFKFKPEKAAAKLVAEANAESDAKDSLVLANNSGETPPTQQPPVLPTT